MVLGLRIFNQRTDDGVPVLDANNGEELMHVQSGVAIVLGNQAPESPGTLYISTKRLMWLSNLEKEKGYAVDFLSVSLHAVSRDPEAYSLPCIYTQVSTGSKEKGKDILAIPKQHHHQHNPYRFLVVVIILVAIIVLVIFFCRRQHQRQAPGYQNGGSNKGEEDHFEM